MNKPEQQGANALKTTHIDSGIKRATLDAAFKPIELTDAKEARILNACDSLSRPIRLWAMDKAGEDFTLRQKLIYGDHPTEGPTTPENTNHLGRLYKHYDEAGLLTINQYDFKGNVLQKSRAVIADSEITGVFTSGSVSEVDCYRVDWDENPQTEGNYQTDLEYDALNRVVRMLYPEDAESERMELLPEYNKAGALSGMVLDETPYVNHIAYNAKGQRILIALGNDIMTRYAYDPLTFRLMRQRSEKYTQTDWEFESDNNVKQDTAYQYDLAGNIIATTEAVTGCGIGGTTDELERVFDYDPLYRLLKATRRENAPTITPIWDDAFRSPDNSLTTGYTEHYQYDRMGNILKLQHIGNANFTRLFDYTASHNKLQSIEVGMDTHTFAYDAAGNLISENADRHYEWDAFDRMKSFRIQAGTSEPTKYAHYLYDAGGNRVKKIVRLQDDSFTSTTYIDGIFESLTDGDETQNTLHIMDDRSRIATVRLGDDFGDSTPEVQYNLEDHLGSSCVVLQHNGATISKEEYYPFGETSFGSYTKKRYKYCGKERDNESGLYYYGARYYAAWTCRFVSVDPLAADYPYLTPFNYAGNKAITHKDIDGLEGTGDKPFSNNIKEKYSIWRYGIALRRTQNLNPQGSLIQDHITTMDQNLEKKWMWVRDKRYKRPEEGGARDGWKQFTAADLYVLQNPLPPNQNPQPAPNVQLQFTPNGATFNLSPTQTIVAPVLQIPPRTPSGTLTFSTQTNQNGWRFSILQGGSLTQNFNSLISLQGVTSVPSNRTQTFNINFNPAQGNLLFFPIFGTPGGSSQLNFTNVVGNIQFTPAQANGANNIRTYKENNRLGKNSRAQRKHLAGEWHLKHNFSPNIVWPR